MKVLVIDGPARGTVREIKDVRFKVLTRPVLSIHMPFDAPLEPPEVTYHVHKFYLCDRLIRMASIHTIVDDIKPSDAFEAIASPAAKEAAE